MLAEKFVETTEYATKIAWFGRPLDDTQRCPGVMLRRKCRWQAKQLDSPDKRAVWLAVEHLPAITTCTYLRLVIWVYRLVATCVTFVDST